LAHFLLAEVAGHSFAGTLAGDFVRGPLSPTALPPPHDPALVAAARFHRAVDAFTDDHIVVAGAKARIAAPHRRWAGVLVDIWFDHILAQDWARFLAEPLESFAARVGADLRARRSELPPRAHPFLDFLLRTNLLVSYRTQDGITRALDGLSRRVGRENPLGTGLAALVPIAAGLDSDFARFFPDALALARIERAGRAPEDA
jgi:acyl carrier protein phosphodiesterase